ncbi:class I SAM-dependent DNA methyltransferase [Macrococcus armenti]|uniref:class I SAM-dependent DNA methyltransferase n=1 Tax=Macrococcus armenti TaxID=2875764 RepID=UPI001CCD7441|nr:class I SAM-dependent methyltransferase [Macrococcus armenti]UBH12338.1 class I SAM-dependent methyltransferase [Macrococcus armenti]UBH21483.1 class I SAM-dependent methyltransferase [Macrococcus armenti]
MEYGQFAHIYDRFMYDQPYENWAQIVQPYIPEDGSVLDIATGTGKLLQLISARDKVGVDLSEEMLTVAQHNVMNAQFIVQDMTQLNLDKTFDTITCLCDSLNYLQSEDEVITTFQNVYHHLNDGGTFIFDVHTVQKFELYFNNETYSDDLSDIVYIWHAIKGDTPLTVYHEMTFFVSDGTVYERFDESHEQRTFPIEFYISALEQTGFEIEQHFFDFDIHQTTATETSERVFFVVKKQKEEK